MDPIVNHQAPETDIDPECHPCVVRQALRTAQVAGLAEVDQLAVLKQAMTGLIGEGNAHSTQHIGRQVADTAIRLAHGHSDADLFHEIKERSNRLALAFLPALRRSIANSADPLATAIRIAAAGNAIDLGAKDHASLDLVAELESIASQSIVPIDIEAFRTRLQIASDLLYICDNAGEIVFDRLLMETLLDVRPGLRIHAAFRDLPILNDVTMDDAIAIGMPKSVKIISSGSAVAGTFLEECTPRFRELFANSDIVLSKGQGNYGTLRGDADQRVFFLLRIKCQTVARLSGLDLDTLQFIQAAPGADKA